MRGEVEEEIGERIVFTGEAREQVCYGFEEGRES